MKHKIIYGSDKDDFIWKMETVYNPIEKLHLKLAKWHLRKFVKVDKEILDKIWLECYNSIIKEKLEYPWKEYKVDEELIEKFNDIPRINYIPKEDLEKAINDWKKYPLWNTDPMCNAVVKLKGDENEAKRHD